MNKTKPPFFVLYSIFLLPRLALMDHLWAMVVMRVGSESDRFLILFIVNPA